MACTTQSALDYVKQARVHLVGELKSLSVIVENLYQREVLTDEEVSKIQAETDDYDKTRHILDSVIKKGEAACYEFLRIIDMTRRRTLGRPPLPPEKKGGAFSETKTFDLHHWISCYPFKEDTHMDMNYLQGPMPCHRYQAKLKEKAERISNKFWMANKNLFEGSNKPDLSYTSLVLDTQGNVSPSKIKKLKSKKSKMSRPKKLRTYIPEDKPEISPSDLLKTDKSIVLVGKPGIGKTALTQEMLKLWAERDSEELDYMFYFGMRETSQFTENMSLEDLLFSVFSEPDEGKEEVLADMKKNSESVTIIFDGITDLSSSVVRRLVEKDLLPDAKIIITCRPDDEEDFFSWDSLRVEVKGFSEQSIETYLSATLGEQKSKVWSNLELLTLCYVPMYAVMVAACFSTEDPQPCTITEVYISIVRFCLQTNSNKTKTRHLESYINSKGMEILSLAEVAFQATEGKTANLTELPCKDSSVLSFLKPLVIQRNFTERYATHAFLHYTMQEFFAALWLLKNPDKAKDVLQQCLTEGMKHMRHLIPFMCGLLSEKSPSLMKCLIPAEELKNTSNWFFKEMITTFSHCLCEQDEADTEDSGSDVDILFLCRCLYESQCPDACIYLLDKLDYCLDLAGESLDPYSCYAVAYVVTQSKEKKIQLNLEDVMVSEHGMRRLFGCLKNVQWCDPLPRQLWKIFLLGEGPMDHISLLALDGNQLHLPVEGKRQLFERAVKVMQKISTKVNVCLYWNRPTPVCQSLCELLLEAWPHINSLSFRKTYRGPGLQDQDQHHGSLGREEKGLLLDLCLKAALHKGESFLGVVNALFSLFSVENDNSNIYLDFYQRVESERCSSVIPKLRALFQSVPVWFIDLSERKASILLEVLKLQSEKKQVVLTSWSHEDSEVRSFLQCLPYISQLSFSPWSTASDPSKMFANLFCAAAEREQQTGEKILELLSSVCRHETFPFYDTNMDNDLVRKDQCDFQLDLFFHVKDYETKTGLSVLPALQSVFQSAPAVWFIDLSKRKSSILLEVLKLHSEKKQVVLTSWSHEDSEVRSFLQCLPYISQLSFSSWFTVSDPSKMFANLFCAAAEREQQTGEKILELLSSVCRYKTFPFYHTNMDNDLIRKNHLEFQLELFSHVKDYETKTGLSVLPALQSVFQSFPRVCVKYEASDPLQVLNPQPLKDVGLTGWSPEMCSMESHHNISVRRGNKMVVRAYRTSNDSGIVEEPNTADINMDVSEDDTKLMTPPSSFTPKLQTESTGVSYSFRCPGSGGFQCALTGLVFVMAREAALFYRTVQWDESLLQRAGKIAAGPLFDIKCPEEAVCRLHLPHCETNHALLSDGLLSVIHITDDGMSVLKPLEITDTHVIVKVPHLSSFGLAWPFDILWRLWNDRKLISSQVLLFLRPPNPKTQRKNLNVFLLPRNIPLDEVSVKQRNSDYIEAPSKCKLIKDQCYSVHCSQAYKIQPNKEEFDLDFGPNYHPTFEIRLPADTEEATITVRDQTNAVVWEREVDLTGGPRRETVQRSVPAEDCLAGEDSLAAEDSLPAEDKLLLIRRQFIYRVSESVLNQVLDKLFESGVVNDGEMQSLTPKIKTEKARDMIDIVRRKGTRASSILIAALCEGDQCLSKELKLS